MNIPKAIEGLTLISTNLKGSLGYEGVEALKLGIEALKFTESARDRLPDYFARVLPGETKD